MFGIRTLALSLKHQKSWKEKNTAFVNIALISKIESDAGRRESQIHDTWNCNVCFRPVREVVTQMMVFSKTNCCLKVNNTLYPNKNVFKHSWIWTQYGSGFEINILPSVAILSHWRIFSPNVRIFRLIGPWLPGMKKKLQNSVIPLSCKRYTT